MAGINMNEIAITNEDLMSVMHEALFKGYENQLREIQKTTGASDKHTEAVIKECDEKMKQVFFDAGNKLDLSR